MKHKKDPNDKTLGKLQETRKQLDELLTYQAEGALRFTSKR